MKGKDGFIERLIATLELAAAMVLLMLAIGWGRDALAQVARPESSCASGECGA